MSDTEFISESILKNLFKNMDEGFALHKIILDDEGLPFDYRFLMVNNAFESATGLNAERVRGKTVKEILPDTEQYWIDTYGKVAMTGQSMSFSNYAKELDKHFKVNVYSPSSGYFVTIFMDITLEKKALERIEHLSYRDQLTGLYNRHFYSEELSRLDVERNLPFSVAMIDVNGLKLTNDAFGHLSGDRLLNCIADVLKDECRADDIICRVGGDEFVVLLPGTSHKDAELIVKRIYRAIERQKVDKVIVSASIGWGTKIHKDQEMDDVLRKAEDYMYKKKVTESQSMRNQTIKSIMQTLNESDIAEKIHSERVSGICKDIGQFMGLDGETIKELEIAGLLHDIGKIAIDNSILNKLGSLTEIEFIDVKRHAEVSYQILRSADVYARMAEAVLSHHERWDGNGYPRGLANQRIPLIARIIAVADAYEAMTGQRPYKNAVGHEEALEELKRCSATQFDPDIVQAFIQISGR